MAQRTRAKVGTKYTDDRYNQSLIDEQNATIQAVQAPVAPAIQAPVAPVAPAIQAPVAPVAPVAPAIQAPQPDPLNNLYEKFDTLHKHRSEKPPVDIGQHYSTEIAQKEALDKWQIEHDNLKEEAITAHKAAKALRISDAKTSLFGFGAHYIDHEDHGKIYAGGKKTKKRKKRGNRSKRKRHKTKHKKSKKSKKSKTRKKKRKNFSKTKRRH